MEANPSEILYVRSLSVHFPEPAGVCTALDRVDLSLGKGEVLGLMGRSGSGKTLAATALVGMVMPPGRVFADAVRLKGVPLQVDSHRAMRGIPGREIFMIFQSPASALNPTLRIGLQLSEILVHHYGLTRKAAWRRAAALLERVHLAGHLLNAHPFELSGGMQQRVLIAMALALRPGVLIADEPTTGLDAVTQARILDLFGDLRQDMADAILLISHDLRVLLKLADRIAVMHAGRIVETLPAGKFRERAAHPQSKAILEAFRELEDLGENRLC